jgi:hypothetical protein
MYNGNAQLITFHCLTVKSVTIMLITDREYAAALSVCGMRYDFTTVGMLAKISATMLISSARSGSFVLTQSMMPTRASDRHHTSRRVQAGEHETLSAFQHGGRNYRQGAGRDRKRHQCFKASTLAYLGSKSDKRRQALQWPYRDHLTMFGFALPRNVEIKYPPPPMSLSSIATAMKPDASICDVPPDCTPLYPERAPVLRRSDGSAQHSS